MKLARSRPKLWIVIGTGLPALAFAQAWAANALVPDTFPTGTEGQPRADDAVTPAATGHALSEPVSEHEPGDLPPMHVRHRPEPVPTPETKARKDPLRVPRCQGVRVVATSQSSDPLESVAMIQAVNEPRGYIRRVGSSVGNRRVAFIGRNPVEWSPTVWLRGTDGLCQAVLFDQPPETAKPTSSQRSSAPPEHVRTPALRTVAPSIASKVANLGDGAFRIDRAAAESIFEQATDFLRSFKLRAARKEGKVVGFELQRVAPGTPLDVLGLRNGDILQSLNGFELTGPAQALQAYVRLKTADEIRVKALRNGAPIELEYRIR